MTVKKTSTNYARISISEDAAATGKNVSIVLVGKSGAGKTTLMKTLKMMMTQKYHLTTSLPLEIIDTIGLVEEKEERKRELKKTGHICRRQS